MKSGFLPEDRAPDDIIVGSDRSGAVPDADPGDGAVPAEGAPETASA